jgi:hypothetical protein
MIPTLSTLWFPLFVGHVALQRQLRGALSRGGVTVLSMQLRLMCSMSRAPGRIGAERDIQRLLRPQAPL